MSWQPIDTAPANMRDIALRNLASYLSKASFVCSVDRQAAMNCLEVIAAPSASAQQAEPVAWHIGNPDGTMNKLGAIYHNRKSAIDHFDSYGGDFNCSIVPLYAAPAPASPAAQVEDARDAFAVFRTGFKTTRVCGPDNLYEINIKYRNIDDLHAADDELRAAMSATPPAAEE